MANETIDICLPLLVLSLLGDRSRRQDDDCGPDDSMQAGEYIRIYQLIVFGDIRRQTGLPFDHPISTAPITRMTADLVRVCSITGVRVISDW